MPSYKGGGYGCTGTIVANDGSGVAADYRLANNRTITATGTGASTGYGIFTNSGTIRSTGGTGVSHYGSGVSTNSGTISSAAVGNATLLNGATGRITGVITSNGGRAIIANARLIVGAVDRTPPPEYYDSSDDIFVDNGGSVTGAILLGGGDDQLIVDLDNGSSRPLAGAAGGVDAGAGWDTIRYRATADASAALALPQRVRGIGL